MEDLATDRGQLSVTAHDDSLMLKGKLIAKNPGVWVSRPLDAQRIILSPEKAATGIASPDGIAGLPILLFTKFLVGLHYSKWSGLVSVDTGYGLKKLFFSRGELVFAASNLIDDRLGEVIYREAQISLDELTKSAAQVTKMRKFGQVLIASGDFDQYRLWEALAMQVKQIVRSIFMVDRVYFEIQEGSSLAANELVLPESTGELLHEAASYGAVFRSFLNKLSEESVANLTVEMSEVPQNFGPSTFLGDIIILITQYPNVQMLLDASKLMDLYTVAALFHLTKLGLIKIVPEQDDVRIRGAFFHQIRAKVDAYSFVLAAVRKAFKEAGSLLPISDIKKFIQSRNPQGWSMLAVEDSGELTRDATLGLFQQVQDHYERLDVVLRTLEALIQFVIQLTGDNLNFSLAMQIRQEYRSVST